MLAGDVSPEDPSVAVWSITDRDGFSRDEALGALRELAISLHVHEDHPDADFDLDSWRRAMLTLAREVLERDRWRIDSTPR